MLAAVRPVRIALAALILLGGLVHLQQYLDGFASIPMIGPMFLANAVVSGVLAALLVWRTERVWILAAALLAAGSLGAIFISRATGLFGYMSTTFEAPEAVAVISEGAALLVASFILVKSVGHASQRTG